MGARFVHARKKAKRRAHADKRRSQENVTGSDNDAQHQGRGAEARRTAASRRPQGAQ